MRNAGIYSKAVSLTSRLLAAVAIVSISGYADWPNAALNQSSSNLDKYGIALASNNEVTISYSVQSGSTVKVMACQGTAAPIELDSRSTGTTCSIGAGVTTYQVLATAIAVQPGTYRVACVWALSCEVKNANCVRTNYDIQVWGREAASFADLPNAVNEEISAFTVPQFDPEYPGNASPCATASLEIEYGSDNSLGVSLAWAMRDRSDAAPLACIDTTDCSGDDYFMYRSGLRVGVIQVGDALNSLMSIGVVPTCSESNAVDPQSVYLDCGGTQSAITLKAADMAMIGTTLAVVYHRADSVDGSADSIRYWDTSRFPSGASTAIASDVNANTPYIRNFSGASGNSLVCAYMTAVSGVKKIRFATSSSQGSSWTINSSMDVGGNYALCDIGGGTNLNSLDVLYTSTGSSRYAYHMAGSTSHVIARVNGASDINRYRPRLASGSSPQKVVLNVYGAAQNHRLATNN